MKQKIGVFDVINTTLMVLFAFICCYPFFYLVIYSLSTSSLTAIQDIWFWPVGATFQNYAVLLKKPEIWNAFFISAARAIIGTIITVICSSFLAYLLSQKELIGRKFFYRMTVITMYLEAGLIPYFIIMKTYGLKNSFLLYIIPSAVTAYFVILIKNYIESLPRELNEAALIDGANHFQIYGRVIFPVCKPVLSAVCVFSAVNQWNMWQDNFYLVRDRELKTLQLYLVEMMQTLDSTMITDVNMALQHAQRTSSLSMKACIAVITMLPVMVVYPLMQRYFVKGIMLGAVKG